MLFDLWIRFKGEKRKREWKNKRGIEGEGKEEKVVPFPYSAMENKQKKRIYSTKD